MTCFSEEMLISNICIRGFMCSAIKKSWKLSTVYTVHVALPINQSKQLDNAPSKTSWQPLWTSLEVSAYSISRRKNSYKNCAKPISKTDRNRQEKLFFVIVFCIFNRNNDKNPQAIPLLTNQPLTNLIIPQSTSHKSETILLPPRFEPGPPHFAAHSLLH